MFPPSSPPLPFPRLCPARPPPVPRRRTADGVPRHRPPRLRRSRVRRRGRRRIPAGRAPACRQRSGRACPRAGAARWPAAPPRRRAACRPPPRKGRSRCCRRRCAGSQRIGRIRASSCGRGRPSTRRGALPARPGPGGRCARYGSRPDRRGAGQRLCAGLLPRHACARSAVRRPRLPPWRTPVRPGGRAARRPRHPRAPGRVPPRSRSGSASTPPRSSARAGPRRGRGRARRAGRAR